MDVDLSQPLPTASWVCWEDEGAAAEDGPDPSGAGADSQPLWTVWIGWRVTGAGAGDDAGLGGGAGSQLPKIGGICCRDRGLDGVEAVGIGAGVGT